MTLAVRGRSHECRTAKSEEVDADDNQLAAEACCRHLVEGPRHIGAIQDNFTASGEGKEPSKHHRQQCIPGPTTGRICELTWAERDGRMQSRKKQLAQETFHGLVMALDICAVS